MTRPTFLRTPGHRLDEPARWYWRAANGAIHRLSEGAVETLEEMYQLDAPMAGAPQEIVPQEPEETPRTPFGMRRVVTMVLLALLATLVTGLLVGGGGA